MRQRDIAPIKFGCGQLFQGLLLNHCNLQAALSERSGEAESRRAGADDDDVVSHSVLASEIRGRNQALAWRKDNAHSVIRAAH